MIDSGKARGEKDDENCLCLEFLAWTCCYVMLFGLWVPHCLGCLVFFLSISGLHGDLVWGTETQKGLQWEWSCLCLGTS